MSDSRSIPLLVANWKMNLDSGTGVALAHAIGEGVCALAGASTVQVLLAPPFPYLEGVAAAVRRSPVGVAAQDLHFEDAGAYTGAVSAAMIADVGATHVLVGHSERRQLFGDDDSVVGRKLVAAWRCGLTPILCVGEKLDERDRGRALDVVTRQLDLALSPKGDAQSRCPVVAYEPIWAIGTGRVADTAQVAEVHEAIHTRLGRQVRVLYGGSVTPRNAADLLAEPEIDGVLVGSASLTASSFLAIIEAASSATS